MDTGSIHATGSAQTQKYGTDPVQNHAAQTGVVETGSGRALACARTSLTVDPAYGNLLSQYGFDDGTSAMDTGSIHATGSDQPQTCGADSVQDHAATADRMDSTYHVDLIAQLLEEDYSGVGGEEPGGPGAGEQTASEDSSSSEDEASDNEDIFKVHAMPTSALPDNYRSCFLYRWQLAVQDVSALLRDDVLLPVTEAGAMATDATSGMQLPACHCAFKGCKGQAAAWESMPSDNYCHERNFWQHLSAEHGIALKTIARQRGLRQQKMNEADVLLTLYNAGLAERERNSVPELGASIDRRTMAHVSEVFGETKVKVLMCFSCACKEIAYSGYDKFGYPVQKGKIAMRSNRKQLQKILGGEEDEAARTAWEANLSAKRFKGLYGDTVAADPGRETVSGGFEK